MNMDYARLGRSGLKVSPICLGAMMFGGPTDEATSVRIVDSAREAGVNFIDTADAYGAGKSEEIVGRAVRADRDRWVIATKVGYPAGAPFATGADLSRKYVMHAAEASLRRLGTDYIGLPEGSRAARQDKRMLQTELRPESIALAQRIKAHAEAHGSTASHFAINWVLNNELVNSVIAGPRTFEQWTDYLAALATPFTAADEALVAGLVPAGHSSTPGFTDPQYPVTGRVVRAASNPSKASA
jgi:aryl-alcohol dehydrogenase-like predicted oxidoreductase